MKKVLILGSGINGLMSAYFLGKTGKFDITVIDKMDKEGMGCSYENGCQLSFSHCEPWSSFSSVLSILKMIFLGNAKISFYILKDRNFWIWLLKIFKNSFFRKSQIIKELTIMGIDSKKILNETLQEEKLSFEYNNSGILHFYRKKFFFKSACKIAKIQKILGCSIEILNASQVIKKEPYLKKLHNDGKIVGGIMHYDDASGNIKKFMSQIKKICEKDLEVKFIFNNKIKNILTNKKEITGINSSLGVYRADYYVSCLGCFESELLKGIGLKSKSYPIKGYSFSIPIDNIRGKGLTSILTDPENKIVYSMVNNHLRAAGTFEISAMDYKISKKNIKFLKNTIKSTFAFNDKFDDGVFPWQGYRPYSFSILPTSGVSKKYSNLYLNSGHGSLGWSMSFATAKKLLFSIDN